MEGWCKCIYRRMPNSYQLFERLVLSTLVLVLFDMAKPKITPAQMNANSKDHENAYLLKPSASPHQYSGKISHAGAARHKDNDYRDPLHKWCARGSFPE